MTIGNVTLGGLDLTFLPSDPPRNGRFAAFHLGAGEGAPRGAVGGHDLAELGCVATLELVVPAGASVRRRTVSAALLSPAEALRLLADLEEATVTTATVRAWASVVTAGLGLIGRGRLRPAVSRSGADAWVIGPLDERDRTLAEDLAACMPPAGHCTPVEINRRTALKVHTPAFLVTSAWDALADTLPRTAAAPVVSGSALFSALDPVPAGELRPWLSEAAAGLEGGSSVSLRVELAEGSDDTMKAVLQVSSLSDPSLVVDAASLFSMPPAVLTRFGATADRDILLALRRGARAWEPLGSLLLQPIPDTLVLDDDLLAELVTEGAGALESAGISVLWPSELLHGGLGLRAVMAPQPPAVTEAGFDLAALLEFRYELTIGGEALSREEIEMLAEAKRSLVRIRGRFVAVDAELIAKAQERRARRMSAAAALGAALAGVVDSEGMLLEFVASGPVAEMAARLRDVATQEAAVAPPAALLAQLRPYQLRGLAWLAGMTALGLGGCLADDMGLGKTVQVIALHLHRLELLGASTTSKKSAKGPTAPPTLVVCPTSLLGNWERELGRFAPSLPVRRFHGGGRHLGQLSHGEVVLTTYGILRRERAALGEAGFGIVVADEAQHAKNPLSETAKALRSVPAGSARIALTGTPVENRLTELWSILDWTTPGLLGPLEHFRRSVAIAVERNHDKEATERLAKAVRPFLLRRRKTDPTIAPELPERTVTDVPVPLTTEQVSLYEAEVREALRTIETKSGIARQGLVLRLLTVLKQICNHPAQYLHQPGPLPNRSGKLAALDELLEVIVSAGDSVLVFSQFVEMGALIEAHLASMRIPTLFLHGGVPARGRDEMVSSFQNGTPQVLLLSLKAGGVGLNLTRATHVIHYDRWWNPAVEDQASDRAHRIGQRRAVQIHRLVCEGTLEDRIAELLETKRSLAESVVGEGESWIGELSNAELAALVRLGTAEVSR